jgi:hypothetical protein
MRICPVDLAVCGRPECGGRHCTLAETTHLTICWECGEIVDRHGVVAGTCIACMTIPVAANNPEA